MRGKKRLRPGCPRVRSKSAALESTWKSSEGRGEAKMTSKTLSRDFDAKEDSDAPLVGSAVPAMVGNRDKILSLSEFMGAHLGVLKRRFQFSFKLERTDNAERVACQINSMLKCARERMEQSSPLVNALIDYCSHTLTSCLVAVYRHMEASQVLPRRSIAMDSFSQIHDISPKLLTVDEEQELLAAQKQIEDAEEAAMELSEAPGDWVEGVTTVRDATDELLVDEHGSLLIAATLVNDFFDAPFLPDAVRVITADFVNKCWHRYHEIEHMDAETELSAEDIFMKLSIDRMKAGTKSLKSSRSTRSLATATGVSAMDVTRKKKATEAGMDSTETSLSNNSCVFGWIDLVLSNGRNILQRQLSKGTYPNVIISNVDEFRAFMMLIIGHLFEEMRKPLGRVTDGISCVVKTKAKKKKKKKTDSLPDGSGLAEMSLKLHTKSVSEKVVPAIGGSMSLADMALMLHKTSVASSTAVSKAKGKKSTAADKSKSVTTVDTKETAEAGTIKVMVESKYDAMKCCDLHSYDGCDYLSLMISSKGFENRSWAKRKEEVLSTAETDCEMASAMSTLTALSDGSLPMRKRAGAQRLVESRSESTGSEPDEGRVIEQSFD